jgi:mono/diheme cytochrome c family protein
VNVKGEGVKKFLALVFILLVSAIVLSACGSEDGASTAPISIPPVPAEYAGKTNPLGADAVAAGADVYKSNCAACHGDTGRGDGPAGKSLDTKPRNLVEFQSLVGDDYLYWRISTGIDGSAMIPWKGVLTDDQIWQVIAFIRTLK